MMEDLPNKIRDVLGVMADVRLVKEGGKELVEVRVASYENAPLYNTPRDGANNRVDR